MHGGGVVGASVRVACRATQVTHSAALRYVSSVESRSPESGGMAAVHAF